MKLRKDVSSLTEILGHELSVEGVGGNNVPYEGYVMLDFTMNGSSLQVPFLVTKENIECPIIGFNVIACLVLNSNDQISMLKAILGKTEKKVHKIMITALLATLQTANAKELSPVTILKSGITLKAESIQTISCKIKSV
jgi:hypothetical protein